MSSSGKAKQNSRTLVPNAAHTAGDEAIADNNRRVLNGWIESRLANGKPNVRHLVSSKINYITV